MRTPTLGQTTTVTPRPAVPLLLHRYSHRYLHRHVSLFHVTKQTFLYPFFSVPGGVTYFSLRYGRYAAEIFFWGLGTGLNCLSHSLPCTQ